VTVVIAPTRSPGDRGLGLLIAAVLVILGLFSALVWGSYQASRREALTAARNLTGIFAANFEGTLQRAESDIRVFVPQMTVDDLSGHASEARRLDLETRMGSHLRSFPAVLTYRIFDAQGQSVFGAGPGKAQAKLNVADRAWFQQLRDDPSRDLAISDVIISKATQDQAIIMAVAIRDGDRRFLGAVDAAISMDFFSRMIEGLDLGNKGMISVRRTDGYRLVLRHPQMPERINETLATSPLSDAFMSADGTGEGDVRSPLDNVLRTYVFRPLHRYPFRVIVGLAADDYLASWRRQSEWAGAVTLLLIAALMVLHRRQQRAQMGMNTYAAALRDSEQLAKALMNASGDAAYLMTSDGIILAANQALAARFSARPEDMVGKQFFDLVPPAVAESRRALCRQVVASRAPLHVQDERNGLILENRIYPVESGDGSVIHLAIFSRDITDKQRADHEIHDLASYQRAILGNSPIGIAILDLNRCVIEANDAFARIYGRAGEALKGESARTLYADDFQYEDIGRRAYPLLRSGGTFSDDVLMARRDGSEVWVRLIACMVEPGDPSLGVVWAAEDISERKRLELDLKRSNDELERFAYVASHDLRQPLRMVASYVGLLAKRLSGRLNDDEQSFIGYALDGARRMDRMIIDLLDYSRIGHVDTATEMVPLDVALSNAIRNLETAIAEASATVAVPPGLPIVPGYASELERLFQNLIGNAIKFRAPDRAPEVTLSCRETAREWVIAIADNGIGISPEDQSRLFVVFQRLVTRDQYEGTGIGLAACRKIAEHHRGRIWVESEEGNGCTFLIALPKTS
jgi:PAS domain S-box-containing protein